MVSVRERTHNRVVVRGDEIMLAKDQIMCLAQRHGFGMWVQERDYVYHLFL